MELKNIEQAQKLFPDAVKLQLRINGKMTVNQVRRLLPSSVVLLSCKLSKNYANVIYSEGAAKRLFPDITTIRKENWGVVKKPMYMVILTIQTLNFWLISCQLLRHYLSVGLRWLSERNWFKFPIIRR